MSTVDLEHLLASLPLPEGDGSALRFSTVQIDQIGGHRLGRRSDGEPALLLSAAVQDSEARKRPPRIELEHISVQHDVTCAITGPTGEQSTGLFTVVAFSGGDTRLRSYFLRIAGTLIGSIGPAPSSVAIQEAIRRIVELFRVLAQPQRKSVQGLWAELFVLAVATHPESMVAAWRTDVEDRYDFSAGDTRIEVKSAEGRLRCHRFSLAQLNPPSDVTVLVASVLLERSAGGTSLGELLHRVSQLVSMNPALQAKLDLVVASTLGESLPRALGMAYDWELAQESLCFFSHESVPSIPCNIPTDVTDVHFTADLSTLQPVSMSEWSDGLFAAACRAL